MFQPGQVIKDTYRVERRLGAGGMAEVYLVSHTRLPRQFALKLMLLDMDGRKDFLERFRREAEILAKLRHPHIVDVNDWDFFDGRPYLVMEYLEGETLDEFLHRTGPLSIPVALDICAQIGQALDSTHAAGIIHRDLKPSNIFLDKHGNRPNFVKILDFGIAKIARVESTPLTAQSAIMGTPGYMAPEQALGKTGEIDHRTDQFALAAILYEMLAGRPAFYAPGDAVYVILARIVMEEVAPLPNEQLNRTIQKALSKKPDDRFPSLQAFLAELGGSSTVVLPLRPSPQSTVGTGESTRPLIVRPRRRLPLATGAIAFAAISIVTALSFTKLHRPKPTSPVVDRAPIDLANPMQSPVTPADLSVPDVPPDLSRELDLAIPRRMVTPAKVPPVHLGRDFAVSGADAKQEYLIRICLHRTYKTTNLPLGTIFEFERSATLKVVKWPEDYYPNELQHCLRDAFAMSSTPVPSTVTIRVVKK